MRHPVKPWTVYSSGLGVETPAGGGWRVCESLPGKIRIPAKALACNLCVIEHLLQLSGRLNVPFGVIFLKSHQTDVCLFCLVQLRCPTKKTDSKSHLVVGPQHHNTLLDGEMVVDTDKNGVQRRRFLAYDIMTLTGRHVANYSFEVSTLSLASHQASWRSIVLCTMPFARSLSFQSKQWITIETCVLYHSAVCSCLLSMRAASSATRIPLIWPSEQLLGCDLSSLFKPFLFSCIARVYLLAHQLH